ncbi:hypothetical protein G9A89_000240 [Geosiphon pyriformis]|nr:hypothetical protein G9A89_000240 [Geosiphon pyriformis]
MPQDPNAPYHRIPLSHMPHDTHPMGPSTRGGTPTTTRYAQDTTDGLDAIDEDLVMRSQGMVDRGLPPDGKGRHKGLNDSGSPLTWIGIGTYLDFADAALSRSDHWVYDTVRLPEHSRVQHFIPRPFIIGYYPEINLISYPVPGVYVEEAVLGITTGMT